MEQERAELALTNPLDVSIEAAVELDEVKQGIRKDVPALHALFELLRTPVPAFEGQQSVSMLADIRSYALFRDSLGQVNPKLTFSSHHELKSVIEQLFEELERGIAAGDHDKIEDAKRFCLAINNNLVTKQMQVIYARRERSDSRYISHESAP